MVFFKLVLPEQHSTLRTLVNRVWRDIDRKLGRDNELYAAKGASILARVKRLLEQKPKDKNKLYSLHTPEVECIAKAKACQPYAFGVKVTVATPPANSNPTVLTFGASPRYETGYSRRTD